MQDDNRSNNCCSQHENTVRQLQKHGTGGHVRQTKSMSDHQYKNPKITPSNVQPFENHLDKGKYIITK